MHNYITWYSTALALCSLMSLSAMAQPVAQGIPSSTGVDTALQPTALRISAGEVCSNGIDDDNNGLTDQDDFSCYFNNTTFTNCTPNAVIWTCWLNQDLAWVNLATGREHVVGVLPNAFEDITWAADGKLYGTYRGSIWEIDPNTAQAAFKGALPDGYMAGNSLTADALGNLYMQANNPTTGSHIIKLNIANWKVCDVASLNNTSLVSAGDLTFMNETLYLTCVGGQLAKINVKTGEITSRTFDNIQTNFFGLVSLNDGYLYVALANSVYKVDTATMAVETTPLYSFSIASTIYGFAGYTELCQSPKCPVVFGINPATNPPYCSNPGVALTAGGAACEQGTAAYYRWTDPLGNTTTGNQLLARDSGTYYLEYITPLGTCYNKDSVYIRFLQPFVVDLGNDTSVCEDDDVLLHVKDTTGLIHFKWNDGSTASTYIAPGPGLYWVEANNGCSRTRDSIQIGQKTTGCERFVVVPNAFSPNGDGRNDVFKPIVKGTLVQYEFMVYNRWGQVVFKTNDSSRGWDGTLYSTSQSTGLFTWLCRYQLKRRTPRTIDGTVLLLR